ncbi:MAG: DMT family transporter [Agathobacter sp.]|nr:DMT family transporter [Agathobacter sp.]
MTGLVYICIATLLIALAPVLAKKGIRKSKPDIGAAFAATAFTLICIFLNKGALRGLNVAGWGMWTWIYVLLSGLTTAFGILFLFKSAHNSEVMHFLPVIKCNMVLVILLSFVIYKSQISTRQWIVIALTIIGMLLMIIGEGGEKGWKWLGFAVLSVLCYSAFLIIDSHYLSSIDSGLLMTIRLIIAVIVIWCIAMTSGGGNTIRSMSFLDGVILILAGVVYGLSMIVYSRAAAALGSSQLMYIYNANLFVSMIFATLLLGEKITPKKLIGALLMIAALFI